MPAANDILLDFSNMMSDHIGQSGVEQQDLEGLYPLLKQIHKGLGDLRRLGQLPYCDLPYQDHKVERILSKAAQVRDQYENILLLGIGGSALGARCLQKSLVKPFTKLNPPEKRQGPRLFIIDNIDAAEWESLAETLDWKKTLIVVISKSGKTTETISAFLYFRQFLVDHVGTAYRQHLLFITDPKQGALRKISEHEKIETFEILPGIGGRFSVFTAVGLFPAACLGINIEELLAGARRMDERCKNADPWFNPAIMSASLHYLFDKKKKRRLRVIMPYGEQLKAYGDWFAQLWAESLGKRYSLKGEEVFAGTTPVRAMGVCDQHSQLQLYLDGPRDKVVTFVALGGNHQAKIPHAYETYEEFAILGGKSIQELLDIERVATAQALAKNGCPNQTLLLRELSAHSLGQLLFLAQVETVFLGQIYNINPFDQPGVELIKKYIYGALHRPGYEIYQKELASLKQDKKFQI